MSKKNAKITIAKNGASFSKLERSGCLHARGRLVSIKREHSKWVLDLIGLKIRHIDLKGVL